MRHSRESRNSLQLRAPETIPASAGMTDAVELTKALIAAESVTPARGSVFDVLEAALLPLGFKVERFVEGEAPDGPVENLLASARHQRATSLCRPSRRGAARPGLDQRRLRAEVRGDLLYGRGAVDMKGAIAAFVEAAARVEGGRDSR
jgi:succinyl-diaminopimelate desuccinylase